MDNNNRLSRLGREVFWFSALQRKEQTPDEVMEIWGSFAAETDTDTTKTATGVKYHAVWAPASHLERMDPISPAIITKGLVEIQEHHTKEVREALGKKGDTAVTPEHTDCLKSGQNNPLICATTEGWSNPWRWRKKRRRAQRITRPGRLVV